MSTALYSDESSPLLGPEDIEHHFESVSDMSYVPNLTMNFSPSSDRPYKYETRLTPIEHDTEERYENGRHEHFAAYVASKSFHRLPINSFHDVPVIQISDLSKNTPSPTANTSLLPEATKWVLSRFHVPKRSRKRPHKCTKKAVSVKSNTPKTYKPIKPRMEFGYTCAPKPIDPRFVAHGFVSLEKSRVGCLDVILNYQNYSGGIEAVLVNKSLVNNSCAQLDRNYSGSYPVKSITQHAKLLPEETVVGFAPGYLPDSPISFTSGVMQRKIYVRNIDEIKHLVSSIIYDENPKFSQRRPYEPQWHRFELDKQGTRINKSKCSLCPYCPEMKFLALKNSAYLSHLALTHGVLATRGLVPEALYVGEYQFHYTSEPGKNKMKSAIQCPACFSVIELTTRLGKTNPLLKYFRHYKKMHFKDLDPVMRELSPLQTQWREGNTVVAVADSHDEI